MATSDAVHMPSPVRQTRRRLAVVGLALSLVLQSFGGCSARATVGPHHGPVVTAPFMANVAKLNEFRRFSLTIYGYNYTDTGIGLFEVNGRSGGNLAVSTPTTAGGSSLCCAALFTPLPAGNKLRIKWNRNADVWCEQEVAFEGPVPSNAEYLEVHFYRDGHIELAATAAPSPPRVKLDRLHRNSRHADPSLNVNNDDKLSNCRNGYF